MMKRSLGQKFFFAIIGPFRRYITNPRGTLVENVKKVKNQPTLVTSLKTESWTFYWLLTRLHTTPLKKMHYPVTVGLHVVGSELLILERI
jgi:hypothetical protein